MTDRTRTVERMSDGLDYIRHHYNGKAQAGRRVTVYTGERGTIVGACPQANHYLHVLMDGDTEPIVLHHSWEIEYHDEIVQ